MPVGAGTVQEIERELIEAFGGKVGRIPQLVEVMGCSEQTIRRQVWRRRIPHFRVGKQIRFRAAAIARWIHAQESQDWRQVAREGS